MEAGMDAVWDEVNQVSDSTFPGWRSVHLLYWSTAIAGEVGEFCNLAKKREEGGSRAAEVTKDALVEELVDVYIYLQKTVECLGTGRSEFSAMVRAKLAKIQARQGLNG